MPVSDVVACNVTVPYDWSLTDLTGNIAISYSVSGQNESGAIVKSTGGGFAPILVTTTGTTVFIVSTVF